MLCAVAAAGFGAAGLAFVLEADWWRAASVAASLPSAGMYVLAWNGRFRGMGDRGAFGVLINAAIIVSVVGLGWPETPG